MHIPEFKFALTEGLDCSFLPTKSEPLATGWDVRYAGKEEIVLKPFDTVKLPLGFRMFAPPGWWLELRPRSSTFAKKNLNCLYGVIDQTFSQELLLGAQWLPPLPTFNPKGFFPAKVWSDYLDKNTLIITPGEKLGQVIPVKRQVMSVVPITNEKFDELCVERNAERKGGFGSTGDK